MNELRAPVYEEKVINFTLELVKTNEKKVSHVELIEFAAEQENEQALLEGGDDGHEHHHHHHEARECGPRVVVITTITTIMRWSRGSRRGPARHGLRLSARAQIAPPVMAAGLTPAPPDSVVRLQLLRPTRSRSSEIEKPLLPRHFTPGRKRMRDPSDLYTSRACSHGSRTDQPW